MLEATVPPPMRTTSAVCIGFVTRQENAAVKPTPISTTKANQPNTTANAVPVLTLLIQVIPIAAKIMVQMANTSNGDKKLYRTGFAADRRSTRDWWPRDSEM